MPKRLGQFTQWVCPVAEGGTGVSTADSYSICLKVRKQALGKLSCGSLMCLNSLISCTELVTCLIIILTIICPSYNRLDNPIVQPWRLRFLWISLEFRQCLRKSVVFFAIVNLSHWMNTEKSNMFPRLFSPKHLNDSFLGHLVLTLFFFPSITMFIYFILKGIFSHWKMKKHDSPHLDITMAQIMVIYLWSFLLHTYFFLLLCNSYLTT